MKFDWGSMFEDMFKRKAKKEEKKEKEVIKIVEKIVYKRFPLFEKQTSTETIDGNEAKDIVKASVGSITFNKADALYKLVDLNHFERFLAQNQVSERVYVANDHDCDDFSFELMGDVSDWDSHVAFGICWGMTSSGGAHAWNWFIGTDRQFYFIEPQTNAIFLPTTEKLWWVLM